MERRPTIEVRGLTKKYGNIFALNDVNFKLYGGDIFGFIGPNGAGKTTTLRILATTLSPTSGEVNIAGYSLGRDTANIRGITGFMPDYLGTYNELLVKDYLEFFARAYHIPSHLRSFAIKEVVALTLMDDLLNHPVESLSRGMKQRLGLAKTVLHNPKILLLDEPASGLDPRARVEFRDIIKGLQKQDKTIIISSHILSDLADLCNKVGIIEKGRMILTDETENLISKIPEGKRIRLKTLGKREEIKIILDETKDVTNLLWDGDDLVFIFKGNNQSLQNILKKLIESEIPVYSFSEIEDSLESVYMKITEQFECTGSKMH